MQWILRDFDDTGKLAGALDRLGAPYSFHKVIPFAGELTPEPEITDPSDVVLFGAYFLRRYAERQRLSPGVFKLSPFIDEAAWEPHLLNGPSARRMTVREIPDHLAEDGRLWFVRPVADSKELAGSVMEAAEIRRLAGKVLSLPKDQLPNGSLSHDTLLMLSQPARILSEWRLWVVREEIVAFSLCKSGSRAAYRREIDDDVFAFAWELIRAHPGYSPPMQWTFAARRQGCVSSRRTASMRPASMLRTCS